MTKRKNQIVPLVNVKPLESTSNKILPIEKRNSVRTKLNRIYAFFSKIYANQSKKLEGVKNFLDTFNKIEYDFTLFVSELNDIANAIPENNKNRKYKENILGFVKAIERELSNYIDRDEPTTGEPDER